MLVSITLAAVLAAGEPGASTAPTAAPVSSAPTAATPVAPLPVLTFDDALAQARQHSVELEVAAAKLAQAKSLSGKAWSYYLPHLSAGASISRNSDEAVLDLPTAFAIRNIGVPSSVYDPSNPAGPTPYDPTKPFSKTNLPGAPTTNVLVPYDLKEYELQRKTQWGAQAQLTQAIIAPALWPAIHNAYLAQEVAGETVEATRRNILFGAAQLYYAAAGLHEAVRVQESVLETYRQQEKVAGDKVTQGYSPRLSLLLAQTKRAGAEQEVLRARNAYASARVALATLLDRRADFDVTMPPPVPAPAAAALSEANEHRPDVRAARAAVALAHGRRQGVWLKYAPSLGVTATVRHASISGFTGEKDMWSLMAGVTWDLWDGGLRDAELEETEAKEVEAAASLRLAENKTRAEVERAVLDRDSAIAARAKAEEQVRLAGETMAQAQQSFAAGAATYLEVSEATSAQRGAELQLITETLNTQLANLRLAKAAGLFEADGGGKAGR